jgi:hypothetical protein
MEKKGMDINTDMATDIEKVNKSILSVICNL